MERPKEPFETIQTATGEENRRILVIDDDLDILMAYQAILAPDSALAADSAQQEMERLLGVKDRPAPQPETPFELAFANQGQEGCQMVEEALAKGAPFAMAFIDIRMPPGWDGVKTAATIRRLDPAMEIVIITAYSDRPRAEIVQQVGAPDKLLFLRKPFDPEEITQLACCLTGKWNLARRAEAQQRQLARSEARFRTLVTSSKDWVWEIDTAGRLLYCSSVSEAMYGYRPEELLGKSLLDTLLPPTEVALCRQTLERCLQHRTGFFNLERRGRKKNGQLIITESTGVPVLDDQGRVVGFQGIEHDITDRKRTEAALIQAKNAAEAASRAKSAFLANMSHEIRTPMNGILGMADLLQETELSSDQREFVTTIRQSAESLLTIINDILDFSKIEAGRLEIESLPFNLAETVEEVANQFSFNAEEKGLQLVVRYAPEAPSTLVGDPVRIRQVLVNLLGNAFKFTDQGRVVINVERETREGDSWLRLTVSDTGVGIAEDKLEHIFDTFTQADTSTTREYGGTGLGLAICQKLVTLMGGEIGVESSPGQGSRFWFTLPLPTAASDDQRPGPAEPGGLRVLVAERDSLRRQVMEEILTNWQLPHLVVDTGNAALTAMSESRQRNEPFEVVILDLEIEDIDPVILGRRIKSLPLEPPPTLVALATPSSGNALRQQAEGLFDALLTRPVRQSRLMNLLAGIWERKSPPASQENETTPAAAGQGRKQRSMAAGHGLRVLLAEDNPVNQKVATRLLSKLGCRVEVAMDGAQALEMALGGSYDLILMDCQMPRMDGFTATQRIREQEEPAERVPIIALTANAMQGDRERCLAAGMDDYLSKPVRLESLAAMLEKWRARKAPQPPERNGAGAGRGEQ